MDDGTSDRSGFILHTNSFNKEEVSLLFKVLADKFDLNCSLHTRKKTIQTKEAYTIYIKSGSYNKFINLVSPYFHPSMNYKLVKRGSYSKK